MNVKKLLIVLLAAACLLGSLAIPAAAEPIFPVLRSYTPGQFPDVGLNAWYTPYVAQVYELGLMQGNPAGAFCPGGNVTLAETVTLASRLHKLYHSGDADFPETEPWYQVYVDYAQGNGMLLTDYAAYDVPAKRSEFAGILARALPAAELPEINALEDGAIPDVAMTDANAAEIYQLYRAGVLRGNDAAGTFAPDTEIRRSEVAAIAARLADPDLRGSLGQSGDSRPDLTAKEPIEDDDYFADAAMLGNSLVDGMRLFSGLKLNYFGGTSLTVYRNRLDELLQNQYGKVYIQLGINELGGSMENFIEGYRKILLRIQETMPEAEIYIMALTPVTQKKNAGGVFTMERIGDVNTALYALAEETGCWYLDTCTLLCDETGFLPERFGGWDGSPHLSVDGYKAWADVIRTYYAQ